MDELRAVVGALPRADRTRALALIDAVAEPPQGAPIVPSCAACRERFRAMQGLRSQLAAALAQPADRRWPASVADYLEELAAQVETQAPRTHEQRRSFAGALRYAASAVREGFTVRGRSVPFWTERRR